mmetsp:Transcript_15715/g.33228  ORF Transcript_15715/g.33228 Transcript_15715/m.33228 type:complete len:95 (+) Transcript_15715:180-464(+)
MKINLDRWRILHLLVLMGISFVLAEILIAKMGWTGLSAYGFACTITTQINNAINPDPNAEAEEAAEKKRQEKRDRVVEKRQLRRKEGVAGKKKR